MSVSAIKKDSEGYVIIGTTNIGRPISITISLENQRKLDVSIAPAQGSPTEEHLIEKEFNNIMMEQTHAENRIKAIFEATPPDADDKIIIAAVSNIISRDKISIDDIENLISDETNTLKI